jgi:glycerol-3-phosphate dehydrogenase (NAD+)
MAQANGSESRLKVALIGSGNWGSAIASIICHNVKKYDLFDPEIRMYVFEELVDGRKLTDIINQQHENVKYLRGIKIGENVVAVPDLVQAVDGADILIFVQPHNFVRRTCETLRGHVKPGAYAISLIKGFGNENGQFVLMSEVITSMLNMECSVLMGANLADGVAKGEFCESTIGCSNVEHGRVLKRLFHTDNFMITVVKDVRTVEICGALKNIVACASGFATGMGLGENTNAAVMRLGLKEMIRFCRTFYSDGFQLSTITESCGMADLVTTCNGGRNRRVSLEFAKRRGNGVTMEQLEAELLGGQKLQGPQTAAEVYVLLQEKNLLEK